MARHTAKHVAGFFICYNSCHFTIGAIQNMPQTSNRAVMRWLSIFATIVAFLIVFGAFVSLTRSGLSITEWYPVSGSVSHMSAQALQQEFARYIQILEIM